ncbi:MAG: Glycosyl transferase family 2 [Candidatus Falkowbacteria bacterium GW2011_GWF2_43_32]|nr:MAG: Glycosyl transferase family 2 [Candidatus Falkowbacteria bacterium GW2011_GWF2_43_32]
MIKYSFIIPVKTINDYIREAVPKILEIESNGVARDDYEIIIYPDEVNNEFWSRTRQIATGHCGPATKRSRAIKEAVGEILIFIDDDAYPERNFLDILDSGFTDEQVKAIGGPALTPPHDSFWAKVSGAVFLSSLSGGNPERYVSRGAKRSVDDWPSVNFSIRKTTFTELGGFDSEFWPGEDTKLCLDLIKKYPASIIYDPALIVYHHRRPGLRKHLKQVSGYGLHRGFFAKKYPATSRRFKYFLPSAFLLFVISSFILGWLSQNALFGQNQIFKIISYLCLFGWVIYFLALIKALFDIRRYEKNIFVALNAVYYIVLTHLIYGYSFLRGLSVKNLKSKLR